MRTNSKLRLGPSAVSLALALTGLGLVGCESVDSDEINTKGLYAEFSATDTGLGDTTVFARLRVGGPNSLDFLNLVGGDTLVAHHGEEEKKMTEREPLPDLIGYAATFTDSGEGVYGIDFERPDETSALGAQVTVPPGFAPIVPAEDAVVSRAAELQVAWTPPPVAGSRARVYVQGSCFTMAHIDAAEDPGEIVIPASAWQVSAGREGETCDGVIVIERINDGTVPSAFKDGVFLGIQQRVINVSVTP